MIISAPTALYKSILPKSESDPSNVTFTVSSNDPPRSSQNSQIISSVEELRQLPERVVTQDDREKTYGTYVFSVAAGSQTQVGLGTKSFEVGQILEFEEEIPGTVTPLEVPEEVDIQHNTNLLDYQMLGLTQAETNLLIKDAKNDFNKILDELNLTMTNVNNYQIKVQDNQKEINETRKAKDAAKVVLEYSGSTAAGEIYDKLVIREAELLRQRQIIIDELNALNSTAKDLYNKTLELQEVVR